MNKALRNIQRIEEFLAVLAADEAIGKHVEFLKEHAANADPRTEIEKHRLPLLVATLMKSDSYYTAERELTDMLGFQPYVISKWLVDALNSLPVEWVDEMGDRLKKDGLIFGKRLFQLDRRTDETRQKFEDLYKHVPEELKSMVHTAIDSTSAAESRNLPVRMRSNGLHGLMILLLPESNFKREQIAEWKQAKTFGETYKKAQENISALADYLGISEETLAHVPKAPQAGAPLSENAPAEAQESGQRKKLSELFAANKITSLEVRILEEIFKAQARYGANNMHVDMAVVSVFNKKTEATQHNLSSRVSHADVRILRERAHSLLAMSPAAPAQK